MDFEAGLAIATLWQEARGEDALARRCVAHAIRNRMSKRYTSDGSIIGTVLVPWQFSGWMDDAIARESLQYVSTDIYGLGAVWEASGTEDDPTGGAVLYYSPEAMRPAGSIPAWVSRSRLTLTMANFLFYAA